MQFSTSLDKIPDGAGSTLMLSENVQADRYTDHDNSVSDRNYAKQYVPYNIAEPARWIHVDDRCARVARRSPCGLTAATRS